MDDTQLPHPPIMPQASEPPTYGPVGSVEPPVAPNPPPPVTTPKKFKLPPWAIIAGIVLILVIGSILFATSQTPTATVETTPTPTATASAISNRVLSPIATQSAFLKFETDLDTLTRGIQNTQIQNQQLLPPRIDLPLGFSP